MNGGNPREDLIAHKDPELAKKLEHSAKWKTLSLGLNRDATLRPKKGEGKKLRG